jgi:hypothetical protein
MVEGAYAIRPAFAGPSARMPAGRNRAVDHDLENRRIIIAGGLSLALARYKKMPGRSEIKCQETTPNRPRPQAISKDTFGLMLQR